MYLTFILPFLALLSSASSLDTSNNACQTQQELPLKPGSSSQLFTFHSEAGGGEREYLLHVPKNYNKKDAQPLILAFHGKNQSPKTFENETQLSNPRFNDEAIVVYPQGIKEQWTGDPTAPLLSEINDITMVRDLITNLKTQLCIDATRIHAYGFSNGGGLVDLLACNPSTSRLIASFSATSAAIYKDSALKERLFSYCPSRNSPVPFLRFHGTRDEVIDFDGVKTPDGYSYPVVERVREWAERNGCPSDVRNTTTLLFEDKVQRYGFECEGFEDVVALYRIEGFGHGVPTTTPLDNDFQRFGPTYFNATPIVLDFFKKWPLPKLEPESIKDEL